MRVICKNTYIEINKHLYMYIHICPNFYSSVLKIGFAKKYTNLFITEGYYLCRRPFRPDRAVPPTGHMIDLSTPCGSDISTPPLRYHGNHHGYCSR